MEAGLRAVSPALADAMSDRVRAQMSDAMKFYAVDGAAASDESTATINVLRHSVPKLVSLEIVMEQAMGGLNRLTGIDGKIDETVVELSSGKAGRFAYVVKSNLADGGTVNMNVRQFVFVKDGVLYVLTMAVSDAKSKQYSDIFDEVAERFEY